MRRYSLRARYAEPAGVQPLDALLAVATIILGGMLGWAIIGVAIAWGLSS